MASVTPIIKAEVVGQRYTPTKISPSYQSQIRDGSGSKSISRVDAGRSVSVSPNNGSYGSPRHVLTTSQEYQLGQKQTPGAFSPGAPSILFSQDAPTPALSLGQKNFAKSNGAAGLRHIAFCRDANGCVGVRFLRPNNATSGPLTVFELVPEGPAEGIIWPGQLIHAVGRQNVDQLSIDDTLSLFRGAPRSSISLSVSDAPPQSIYCSSPSSQASKPISVQPQPNRSPTISGMYHTSPPAANNAGPNNVATKARIPSSDQHSQPPVPIVCPLSIDTLPPPDGYRKVLVKRGETGTVGLKFMRPESALAGPYQVVDVIAGSGAAESGQIKNGDMIYQVGEWKVTDLRAENVSKILRGAPGSTVEIQVGQSLAQSAHVTPSGVPAPLTPCGYPAVIKMTLSMKMSTAGAPSSTQRKAFEQLLVQDLSNASGHPYDYFEKSHLEEGLHPVTVVVFMRISPDPQRQGDPRGVAVKLQQQLSQKGSPLLIGEITKHCEEIEIVETNTLSIVETNTRGSSEPLQMQARSQALVEIPEPSGRAVSEEPVQQDKESMSSSAFPWV